MSGPDRIFAKSWKHATHSEVGVWSTTQHVGTAEYIRRDPAVLAALPEVQALIAGAFEVAANRMDDGWSYNAGNRIRALTPADAIAARDAMIAAEREACLKIVTDEAEYQLDVSRKQFANKDVCGDSWKTTEWAGRTLGYAAATIRKRGDST